MAEGKADGGGDNWRRVPRPPGSFPPTKLVSRKSLGAWPRATGGGGAQKPKAEQPQTSFKLYESAGVFWGKLSSRPWSPCQAITDCKVAHEYSQKLQLRRPRLAEKLVSVCLRALPSLMRLPRVRICVVVTPIRDGVCRSSSSAMGASRG